MRIGEGGGNQIIIRGKLNINFSPIKKIIYHRWTKVIPVTPYVNIVEVGTISIQSGFSQIRVKLSSYQITVRTNICNCLEKVLRTQKNRQRETRGRGFWETVRNRNLTSRGYRNDTISKLSLTLSSGAMNKRSDEAAVECTPWTTGCVAATLRTCGRSAETCGIGAAGVARGSGRTATSAGAVADWAATSAGAVADWAASSCGGGAACGSSGVAVRWATSVAVGAEAA
nr:hypothetical protein Iba_chr13fCG6770 [Ipomoea batatas]